MANWNTTVFRCKNPAVVKAFAETIRGRNRNDFEPAEGDTEFISSTAWDTPHKEVIELSKKFPDEVITCQYSFEHDQHEKTTTIEYRAGSDVVTHIEESEFQKGYRAGILAGKRELGRLINDAIREPLETRVLRLLKTELNVKVNSEGCLEDDIPF